MCGMRACPPTDVDRPRFLDRTAIGGGAYRLAVREAIPCCICIAASASRVYYNDATTKSGNPAGGLCHVRRYHPDIYDVALPLTWHPDLLRTINVDTAGLARDTEATPHSHLSAYVGPPMPGV